MKLFLTLLLVPFLTLGQKAPSFNKLIEETNDYLNQYEKLRSGYAYYSLSDFEFSEKQIRDLIKAADADVTLSKNKDSIEGNYLIAYFQDKISAQLNQLVKHPDFNKNDIRQLIESDELSIVKSADNKLYNFSFDEKTGGTYRSRISMMYYTEFKPEDSIQAAEFQSFFAPDGYTGIYMLDTDEGTKYLLTADVRGCAYCFETSVWLISLSENDFREEFTYSVNTRDWTGGVSYDPETKTINADYYLDDLMPYCQCTIGTDNEQFDYDTYAESDFSINCNCKFVFDGKNFELIEAGWKRVRNEDRKEKGGE